MNKLDLLDGKILEIISVDARVPLKEVADVCNVSRAAVHQRIQRLMDRGVIYGTGYNVVPKCLGYTTCTYVGIKLERGSMYKEVSKKLMDIPEIVECHFTTGPYTMLIKMYSHDNEHLMKQLNAQIQEIEGVLSTEALISLDQSFMRQLPVKKENIK
ncbi:MAG: Lrp/AsnC ligand binding domain-containing protein [Bacteroidaceae bacterium]|nr:Lrp/AsnC ligand binding domain-containing protein [Bacteroidaceae bacterium]